MKQVQTRILTTVPEYEVEYTESYRPRIRADQMRRLRQIKEETGRPITQLLEEALEQYFVGREKRPQQLSS